MEINVWLLLHMCHWHVYSLAKVGLKITISCAGTLVTRFYFSFFLLVWSVFSVGFHI